MFMYFKRMMEMFLLGDVLHKTKAKLNVAVCDQVMSITTGACLTYITQSLLLTVFIS